MNHCEMRFRYIMKPKLFKKILTVEIISFSVISKSYLIAFIARSSQPVRNDTPPNGVIIANNFIDVTE